MKTVFIIAFALLCAAPAAAEEDCTLHQLGAFNLGVAPNGDPTIPVTVGGKEYTFDLGFGDMHTAVTKTVADAAGAQTYQTDNMITYNGQKTDRAAKLPHIAVGQNGGSDFRVVLLPGQTAAGDEGSLGLDILSQFDVELDLSAKKLKLFSQKHCAGKVVYWGKSYAVIPFYPGALSDFHFTALLDGKEIPAGFSTGDERGFLGMAYARGYLDLDSADPNLKLRTDVPESVKPAFGYPFKSLTVGAISVTNPDIVLYPQRNTERCVFSKAALDAHTSLPNAEATCISSGALIMGRKQMRAMHLFFAFSENNLYVTAADPAPSTP